MAIFDANKKMFLTYYCQLEDPVEIDPAVVPIPVGLPSGTNTTIAALQAAFPNGMNYAPLGAAALFKAPFRGYSEPAETPSVWAPWSSFGNEAGPYPLNTSSFQRHTGGFLGIGGTTVKYYWMGEFILGPADGTSTNPVTDSTGAEVLPGNVAEFALRHFLEGFECPGFGISTIAISTGITCCVDASRHQGGVGLALRGPNNAQATVSINSLAKSKIWNRVYARLRKAPTSVAVDFFRYNSFPSSNVGYILALNPNRTLSIFSSDAVGTRVLVHQSTTPLFTADWDGQPGSASSFIKLDILIEAAGTTRIRVFKNGALFATGVGAPAATHIQGVSLGNGVAQANDLYLDFDDWMSADLPERPVGTENLNGIDFTQGTKIVRIAPKGFSGNHAAGSWSTDFRPLLQRGSSGFALSGVVSGAVSGALLAVDTDSDLAIDADVGQIGVVSLEVIINSTSGAGGGDGSLGFSLNNGAPNMAVIAEGAAFGVNRRMFTTTPTATPAGQAPTLPDATPIELRYQKAANADTAQVGSLQAMVELVGTFGPEDFRATQTAGATQTAQVGIGAHNWPYKYSPWSKLGASAPIAPYIVKSGTYVGNGTGQDLTFRSPPNWLFIRSLAAGATGFIWWSSMFAPTRGFQEGIEYDICDASENPAFIGADGQDAQQQEYRIRIHGSDAQLNQNAQTYWYCAVSDPGMRYMLNGVMSNNSTLATFDNFLTVAEYLAVWGFFHAGDDTATTTRRVYGKGPGNAAAEITNFDSSLGNLANALTFATGKLTSQVAFHGLSGAPGAYAPFALWRRADGNNDTGEKRVVNIGSYVGDGSASRTVGLTPATERRPLFVMVFGAGAANRSYWRDPQHTGSNSSRYDGLVDTSGITGGNIDQFSVGAALNANGVTYNYFVLLAGTTACNNGWGCDGEYVPVEPNTPVDGPWPNDPPDPEAPIPTVPLTDEPDLENTVILSNNTTMIWGQVGGQVCEFYTRGLVNRAMKHLGVGRRFSNLITETSEEAYQARDIIREAINEVLRDHPWPWATEYSALVLVGGTATTPVNKDWQYSYRAPSHLMFARRIVPQDDHRRTHDPNPIKFRLGVDATGILVFSNEPIPTNGTLVLEWTKRITCPAFFGDPLFREAVAWKMAGKMAMPLAKDTKKEAFCLAMYKQTLANAQTPASNESQAEPPGDAPWIESR